jgi:hypothetical protein
MGKRTRIKRAQAACDKLRLSDLAAVGATVRMVAREDDMGTKYDKLVRWLGGHASILNDHSQRLVKLENVSPTECIDGLEEDHAALVDHVDQLNQRLGETQARLDKLPDPRGETCTRIENLKE